MPGLAVYYGQAGHIHSSRRKYHHFCRHYHHHHHHHYSHHHLHQHHILTTTSIISQYSPYSYHFLSFNTWQGAGDPHLHHLAIFSPYSHHHVNIFTTFSPFLTLFSHLTRGREPEILKEEEGMEGLSEGRESGSIGIRLLSMLLVLLGIIVVITVMTIVILRESLCNIDTKSRLFAFSFSFFLFFNAFIFHYSFFTFHAFIFHAFIFHAFPSCCRHRGGRRGFGLFRRGTESLKYEKYNGK